MGNIMHEVQALRLEDLPGFEELCATDFTVLRSANGEHDERWEQSGWRITNSPHGCGKSKDWENGKAYSSESQYNWKVFMNNTHTGLEHACGWRRIGDFWPTGMAPEERLTWFQDLSQKIWELAKSP